MRGTKPKPMPLHVVLICTAKAGEEIRDPAQPALTARCRDCGATVIASRKTTDAALADPERRGRPIEYICFGCIDRYDITGGEIHDLGDGATITGRAAGKRPTDDEIRQAIKDLRDVANFGEIKLIASTLADALSWAVGDPGRPGAPSFESLVRELAAVDLGRRTSDVQVRR